MDEASLENGGETDEASWRLSYLIHVLLALLRFFQNAWFKLLVFPPLCLDRQQLLLSVVCDAAAWCFSQVFGVGLGPRDAYCPTGRLGAAANLFGTFGTFSSDPFFGIEFSNFGIIGDCAFGETVEGVTLGPAGSDGRYLACSSGGFEA